MIRRIALLSLFILLLVPALYACDECTDGHCIMGLQTGWFCQVFPRGGCINDGFCPDGGPLFQAEWRVASVRVLEPHGKPLPKAQPQPAPARVLTAAK